MTVLTPGCDPDMSISGAPFGAAPGRLRLRSGAVLLVVAGLGAYLATGEAVPEMLAVPAAVVGAACALALVMRAVRLGRRTGSAAVAAVARSAHRARPVPAAP